MKLKMKLNKKRIQTLNVKVSLGRGLRSLSAVYYYYYYYYYIRPTYYYINCCWTFMHIHIYLIFLVHILTISLHADMLIISPGVSIVLNRGLCRKNFCYAQFIF